jgi:hypothetical protein
MQACSTLNMMVPRGNVQNRSRRDCNMAVDDLLRLSTSANQLFFQRSMMPVTPPWFCRLQRLKLASSVLELRHLLPLLVRAGVSLSSRCVAWCAKREVLFEDTTQFHNWHESSRITTRLSLSQAGGPILGCSISRQVFTNRREIRPGISKHYAVKQTNRSVAVALGPGLGIADVFVRLDVNKFGG